MSEQKSVLSLNVEVDTKEANENIKELTTAVNECVEAFEKLEKVIDKFTKQSETVELYCDGKLLAHSLVKHTADNIKVSANVIKGVR
ncbi:hypothetical protein IIO_05254 [Bacillus cereus VD115]|nr:hypothetical protein IIO_05254 [Bacillus cereus VD115]